MYHHYYYYPGLKHMSIMTIHSSLIGCNKFMPLANNPSSLLEHKTYSKPTKNLRVVTEADV